MEQNKTKEEVIAQLVEWLAQEDVSIFFSDFSEIVEEYYVLTRKDKKEQLLEHRAIQIELAEEDKEDFNYKASPLDKEFERLRNEFNEKKGAYRKAQKQRVEEVLNSKKVIVTEFEAFLSEEITSVGVAFDTLKKLQERWGGLDQIKSTLYRDVDYAYSHCLDRFYYNVNVIKEFKQYDFDKNLVSKQEIIGNLKKLLEEKDPFKLQDVLRENQVKWDKVGPTHQDKWEEVKQEYWGLVSSLSEKIGVYFKEYKELRRQKKEQKQALVEKATIWFDEVKSLEDIKPNVWEKLTKEIKEFQQEWKKIGGGRDAQSVLKWEEFQDIGNQFFEMKHHYFSKLKSARSENKVKKQALIDEAIKIKDSKEWKKTTGIINNLHKEWKKVGAAHPREDNRLWSEFSGATKHFFKAKDHFFDTLDDRLKENSIQKNELTEEIVKAVDEQTLYALVKKWHTIGYVPKSEMTKVQKAFDTSVSAAAKKIGLTKEVIEKQVYRGKIAAMKEQEGGENQLNDERRYVRSKMDKIKDEIAQYENNLSFFGPSKGAQKLKEVVEKRMSKAQDDLAKWQEKMKVIG